MNVFLFLYVFFNEMNVAEEKWLLLLCPEAVGVFQRRVGPPA